MPIRAGKSSKIRCTSVLSVASRSSFCALGSGGYAVGYYSYLWAEVLDADGFEAFKEKGIFDEATGRSFRKNILEMGGSEEPMTLYKRFRGAEPNPEALLRNRGLID